MITTLRTHVIICAALFVALIGIAIAGNVLQRMGVISPPTGSGRYVAMGLYFTLFLAFGLSAIPVIVKLVVGVQVQAGNSDVAAVAAAVRHQNTIIWALWGLILAGTAIAVPAAITGGMFGDAPVRAINRAMAGPNLGVLAAKPGMTLAELVAQSTMKVDTTYAATGMSGGKQGPFDYTIPGTTLTFPGARYYFITTSSDDPARIEVVNVGVSKEKMPPGAIDSAAAALRARLAADGWLAGHEASDTSELATRHWLKDSIVLTIDRKRMDDAVTGEDAATAGEWILTIDLWPAKRFPYFERYVFEAPRRP